MVTSAFGDNCGMNEKESSFMVPSVQRMMERTPKAVAERMAMWIDPVIIVSIFIMWGVRIRKIKEYEAELRYRITPDEAARAAGYSGATYNVPNGHVTSGVVPNYAPPTEQQTAPNGAYDVPVEPTSNGVPQSIREAFDDRI